MSVATLLRDVAECRAWEMRLHRGSEETRKAAALPGWPEWVMPTLLLVAGLLYRGRQINGSTSFLTILCVAFILYGRRRLLSEPLLTEWESLVLPSRRTWFLARWTYRFPATLWLGCCLLGFLLLSSVDPGNPTHEIRSGLALTFLLAPLCLFILTQWTIVLSRRSEGTTSVLLILTLLLAGVFALVPVLAIPERGFLGWGAYLASGAGCGMSAFLLYLARNHIRSLLKGSRGETFLARLGWGVWAILLGTAGTVSLCVIAGTMVTSSSTLLSERAGSEPAGLYLWFLATCLLTFPLLVLDTLRMLPGVDLAPSVRAPGNQGIPTTSRSFLPRDLSGIRAEGGLTGTAWILYRGRWRNLQAPWLTAPVKALWELRPLAIGPLAVYSLAMARGGFWMGGLYATYLIVVCPSPFRLPASRRLHLLGADYTDVAVHNRRWGLLLAVAPALLGVALAGRLWPIWETMAPEAFWAATAGVAGGLILRSCGGFDHLYGMCSRVGWRAAAMGALAGIAVWVVAPGTSLLVGGPAVLLVALVAVAIDLRDPEAAGRRLAAEAIDD